MLTQKNLVLANTAKLPVLGYWLNFSLSLLFLYLFQHELISKISYIPDSLRIIENLDYIHELTILAPLLFACYNFYHMYLPITFEQAVQTHQAHALQNIIRSNPCIRIDPDLFKNLTQTPETLKIILMNIKNAEGYIQLPYNSNKEILGLLGEVLFKTYQPNIEYYIPTTLVKKLIVDNNSTEYLLLHIHNKFPPLNIRSPDKIGIYRFSLLDSTPNYPTWIISKLYADYRNNRDNDSLQLFLKAACDVDNGYTLGNDTRWNYWIQPCYYAVFFSHAFKDKYKDEMINNSFTPEPYLSPYSKLKNDFPEYFIAYLNSCIILDPITPILQILIDNLDNNRFEQALLYLHQITRFNSNPTHPDNASCKKYFHAFYGESNQEKVSLPLLKLRHFIFKALWWVIPERDIINALHLSAHPSLHTLKLMLKTKIHKLSTTLQKSNRCILEKIMMSLYYICTGRRIANIQQYYLTQLSLNSSAKNPMLHSMDLARLCLQQKDPNPSDKSVIQSLLNKGPTL
ncbi:MAG TPA: hypothetical protein QF353_06020 [Gammaproteobacteria bacterium]|nr:hypothetical protein [Gammaproteobacteria bacterium]